MRQTGDVLFYSLSGLRNSGRTTLLSELETVLPTALGLPRCDFAFLRNPFGDLPHPLLWAAKQGRRPVSLLYACWDPLNEYTETVVVPALARHKVVFIDGFGLDAVLYATARCKSDDEIGQVLAIHSFNVEARLLAHGIAPPKYLITTGEAAGVVKYLRRSMPQCTTRALREFVERERSMMERYFAKVAGQSPPIKLDASLEMSALVEQAAARVADDIRGSLRVAA